MKFLKRDPDEFYIGYLPEAPPHHARAIRKAIFMVISVLLIATLLLAWQQRAFTASNFEYGIETTLEGHLFKTPYPHLVVDVGSPEDSTPVTKSVLLVGFGKAGALEAIDMMEGVAKQNLDGTIVTLRGSLIYGDGTALMQIEAEDNLTLTIREGVLSPTVSHLGAVVLEGEIIDPKCYFGVMKPGEGKPHRSCAIRCIAGGIPPVIKTSNGYYLLAGGAQQEVNERVAPMVGDHVQIAGNAMEINGWNVLQISEGDLARVSWLSKAAILEDGITLCR